MPWGGDENMFHIMKKCFPNLSRSAFDAKTQPQTGWKPEFWCGSPRLYPSFTWTTFLVYTACAEFQQSLHARSKDDLFCYSTSHAVWLDKLMNTFPWTLYWVIKTRIAPFSLSLESRESESHSLPETGLLYNGMSLSPFFQVLEFIEL